MIHPKFFRWLCIPLLILSWINPLADSARDILEDDATNGLESLALLESLYLLAESGSTVELPLISGTFEGAATTLQESIRYLSIANIAIAINLLLSKLAHTKVLLIAMVLLWAGSFWKSHQALFLKMLVVGFLLNPGLDIYTHTLAALDREVQFKNQDTLYTELQLLHRDYVQKDQMRQKEVQERKQQQLAKDKAKGKDHLTMGQKVEDAIKTTASSGVLHLEQDYRLTKKAIGFTAQHSLELVLDAFTFILFMYILLPMGYLWLAYRFSDYWFTHTMVLTSGEAGS